MKYSRRDFIKFGGLAMAAGPAFSKFGFGQASLTSGPSLLENAESMRGLIGTGFTFYRSDSAVTGILVEVNSYDRALKRSSGECFSLVFELPAEGYPQDTYDVFHPSIGKFELFSVAGTSTKGKPLLIAVINRI